MQKNFKSQQRQHNIMPPVVVKREVFHTRRIEVAGYKRSDGLWDIEAWLQDTKGYDFDNFNRGKVRTGDPLHQMRLRLTLNDAMVIQDAAAVTNASPYAVCHEITDNYFQQLIGLEIKAGFTKQVKILFGGVKGCTHITDLLVPMATVAYQTIVNAKLRQQPDSPVLARLVNSCYAFKDDGLVVTHYKKSWQK